MFRKILIANRGEIACRVMRTARELGIKTVAVYSDADAGALHVSMADESVRIGPAPAVDSYLNISAILDACRLTGAEAVHPGYGFLSENPDFADALDAAGLVFIGPRASAIRAMGLKDAAKKTMEQAGVPVVPGYHGEEQDYGFLAKQAELIGYPVLIKARAGGGGKGMRRVERGEDFGDALEGAQREAQAAFGDSSVLIEKYITAPRHIEIQVFGDGKGNALHLFERDCSLQRRYQKVIEEAPAPGMTEEMRAAMCNAAVRAARAINYTGAGTVEFIVDASDGLRADRFYFMEMNTRLQVEHPVTEAITGYDLIEMQLHTARFGTLPFGQEELAVFGHAIEARIYAEDPERGFIPATGILHHLSLPSGVRVDTGVKEGEEISPYYDPMIAKIIVHEQTREIALGALRTALDKLRIAGLTTNKRFLAELAAHPDFAEGRVDTGLIERNHAALAKPLEYSAITASLAALVRLGIPQKPGTDPWQSLTGWRAWGTAEQTTQVMFRDRTLEAKVTIKDPLSFSVRIGDDTTDMRFRTFEAGKIVEINGRGMRVGLRRVPEGVYVFLGGNAYSFRFPELSFSEQSDTAGDSIVSPMPGAVKAVMKKAGDTVSTGEALIVIEAMKVEYTLTAPRDGIIDDIAVMERDQVSDGAILITLSP